MAWYNILDKIFGDTITSADFNQLMENQRIISGNGTAAPSSDIETLSGLILPYINEINIYDCELSNNVTDANNDIDINTGQCMDSTRSYIMTLSSGLTKQLDASWAVGTNAGGLFTGTKAVSTTYHVFLIRKDSDSTIDAGFDTSVTAANIPTGYTAFRRIGSIMTDASGNILAFIHTWQDKTFKLVTKIQTKSSWIVSTVATLYAFDVPIGIKVNPIGFFSSGLPNSGGVLTYNIYSNDELPPTLSGSQQRTATFSSTLGLSHVNGVGLVDGNAGFMNLEIFKTDTSGQIYFIRSGSYFSSAYYSTLQTLGWIDYTL